MKGFFTLQETQSISRPDGKLYSCTSCGMRKFGKTAKMLPFGKFKKHILVISDYPSQVDTDKGKPLQDKAGRMLSRELKKVGIDLFEDCLITHAISCGAEKDAKIGLNEITCCRRFVLETIQEYQPKLIIALGTPAIESLMAHRWKHGPLGTIHKWRGWQIPDQELKAWVCPVYDMKIIQEGKDELSIIWEQDFQAIAEHVNKPFPKWKAPVINIIEDLSPLEEIKSGLISIDYETTGIKPHMPGHRIVCASAAINENECYVFLMPDTKNDRRPFTDLLARGTVRKMAHNMKFEEAWSVNRLRQPVIGWEWDSMIAAHILDNRPGISGLKFQGYVQFGIVDYDSEISPYLKSKDGNGANGINQIFKLLESKTMTRLLLEYCAMDTIMQYRLAMKQTKQMDYSFLPF